MSSCGCWRIHRTSWRAVSWRRSGGIAEQLLPPYAKALADYARLREHSWSAPGHQGGIAFTKIPVGRAFFDFYGENLFRTDMGVERGQLGSLLDHTGPVADSERYAARVFGAHRSYSGVVGTSGSNRTIMQACATEGDLVVLDRNCHKSIEQGLILTGARPVYLVPTRNRYGIIGPIHPPRSWSPKLSRPRRNPARSRAGRPDASRSIPC